MTEPLKPLDLSRLKIDDKAPNSGAADSKDSYRKIYRPVVFASCIIIALLYLAERITRNYNGSPQSEKSASTARANSPNNQSNQGNFASPPAIPRTLAATGYVVAQRKAAVSSKATGRLRELNVAEGDLVKEGQVIGVIESDDLKALQDQALAGVKAAQAQIKSAQAELADAQRQRNRVSKLAKQRVVSQSDFDAGDARFDRAQANLELANANLLVSQAQAEKAKVDLDYSLIRAPFDGTVLDKNADVGEIVTPFGSAADARVAIVTIADMSSLEVEADVSESNISKVLVGQTVAITLDSFPEHRYRGIVRNVVPTVDRAKATVMVRIKFVDIDERVLPEMSAKIEFELRKDDLQR